MQIVGHFVSVSNVIGIRDTPYIFDMFFYPNHVLFLSGKSQKNYRNSDLQETMYFK